MSTPHRFWIEMLGGFRLTAGDRVIARLQAQKPGALLAKLALNCGRPLSRDELVEALWPEAEPVAGRNRLKQTLSVLRPQLEAAGAGALLLADRAVIHLDGELAATDVGHFGDLLRRAALAPSSAERVAYLRGAADVYRGSLLPGFYDEWVLQERERLARTYVSALLDLERLLEGSGALEQAIESVRRAIDTDPSCEAAHIALMRLYAVTGQPAQSVAQYRDLARALEEDYGERPSPEADALLQAIREGKIAARPYSRATGMPAAGVLARPKLEPVGGAVPLSSAFYIVRTTDGEFADAIARLDSIVLVKGPRQVGKTSLLARGLQQARQSGARVLLTDLQRFSSEQLASADSLFRALAATIAEQLDLGDAAWESWEPARGWNVSFERFLRRQVLASAESPVVWGLDEVDRLFPCKFAADVFGLFRSWHNLRSLHPDGPWSRLTLAIAHATEAHLFITDLNQSPFNVGTRLTLADFDLGQVAELNRRYESPLVSAAALEQFMSLTGGIPYLVRRGLHELASHRLTLAEMEQAAARDDSPLHDHLRRLLLTVSSDAALAAAVRRLLEGESGIGPPLLYRLRSAGVLAARPEEPVRFRCRLYAEYLRERLQGASQ